MGEGDIDDVVLMDFNPTSMTCSHWAYAPEAIRSSCAMGIIDDHHRGDKKS